MSGANADEHPFSAGSHQVERGLIRGAAAHQGRDRQLGDEVLEVQRLAVRRHVLRGNDRSLDHEHVETRLERDVEVLCTCCGVSDPAARAP